MSVASAGLDSLATLLAEKGPVIPINTGQPADMAQAYQNLLATIRDKQNLKALQQAQSMQGTQAGIKTGMSLLSLIASLYGSGALDGLTGMFGTSPTASGVANTGLDIGNNTYGNIKFGGRPAGSGNGFMGMFGS